MLYTYGYWSAQQFFLYHIPLFLLLFGLTYIIVRLAVKIQDPLMNAAIAAFTASLAYFLISGQETIQRWFFWHRQSVFTAAVIFAIAIIIYFVLRL